MESAINLKTKVLKGAWSYENKTGEPLNRKQHEISNALDQLTAETQAGPTVASWSISPQSQRNLHVRRSHAIFHEPWRIWKRKWTDINKRSDPLGGRPGAQKPNCSGAKEMSINQVRMSPSMYRCEISSRCCITIPAELRRKLKLKPGTIMSWKEENGQLILISTKRLLDKLQGCLKPQPGEPSAFEMSFEERKRERIREDLKALRHLITDR